MNKDVIECREFLCKIQQEKMKELWDNLEDEEWESLNI